MISFSLNSALFATAITLLQKIVEKILIYRERLHIATKYAEIK